MRTITLELLRHGPSHNQLLSPLTPYMALCQNHGAVTVNMPFEHNQLLHRLSSLNYKDGKDGEKSRLFQLKDTGEVMGEILAKIPGLAAEANKGETGGDHLTHLRLILSASELALLPFELALSANGLPGSGQPLLLQPQMPICLTREVRRVAGEPFDWPLKPRILFASAAPASEKTTIPLESHLQALRKVIDPWIKLKFNPPGTEDEKRKESQVAEYLRFLPGASLKAIEDACSSECFTHVHILAHGLQKEEAYDNRFYLALHDARNPDDVDYVSGPRLATALRAARKPDSRELSQPAVVTLASCDGANVGSVAGAGSSIAHALHEAGIPIVVAGQFPLSFPGSVHLVEVLYEGLLWCTDPRRLLYDLRRRLYSQLQSTHDWASLTAYVALPEDFDQQLPRIQIKRVRGCIDAAMNHADALIRQESPQRDLEAVLEKIGKAKVRFERVQIEVAERCEVCGLLASTEKREAEVRHRIGETAVAVELLRSSRERYWEAFELDRGSSWALVQYLSLVLLLKRLRREPREEKAKGDLEDLWTTAYVLSMQDVCAQDCKVRTWAYSNLAELYLLAPLMAERKGRSLAEAGEQALLHTDALIESAGREDFDVYSAWRQTTRYQCWFNEIADLEPLQGLVKQVLARFPGGLAEKFG